MVRGDEDIGAELIWVFEQFAFGQILNVGGEEDRSSGAGEAKDDSSVVGVEVGLSGGPEDFDLRSACGNVISGNDLARRMMCTIERFQEIQAGFAFVCEAPKVRAGEDFLDAVAGDELSGGADVVEVSMTQPQLIDRCASFVSQEWRDAAAIRIGQG